ncbi:hypothetical protein ACNKHV_24630 [Shigella flexneri]
MLTAPQLAAGKALTSPDMVLMPDASTAVIDRSWPTPPDYPLRHPEPGTLQGYDRDPHSIAKRAEVTCVHWHCRHRTVRART